jgi:5-methylthioadenosine/S-adenosylhomocysteine deaminase
MAKIVIHNTSVLTLDDNDTFFYPGTVEIEGDCITKVYAGHPSEDVKADPSVTLIDGTDKLVMPGLVDLHFHTSVAKVTFPFSLFLHLVVGTPQSANLSGVRR